VKGFNLVDGTNHGHVVVTNPGGQSSTLSVSFNYADAPTGRGGSGGKVAEVLGHRSARGSASPPPPTATAGHAVASTHLSRS
jgi:hypothetical protein